MRMLMIITKSEVREELEVILRREHVEGFTEIPDTVGAGTTGPRMGSAVHPGTSTVIFAILEDSEAHRLIDKILGYCEHCREHLKISHWPVDVVG